MEGQLLAINYDDTANTAHHIQLQAWMTASVIQLHSWQGFNGLRISELDNSHLEAAQRLVWTAPGPGLQS